MIAHAILRIVVRADLLTSLARADHSTALGRQRGLLLLALDVEQTTLEHLQGLRLVLELRALVLTLDDNAGGLVLDLHRTVRRVHALPARSTAGRDRDFEILVVDMDGATAETYEKSRVGLKFETTVRNITNLIKAVHVSEVQKPHIKLQVIQTPAVVAEMDRFWEYWNPILEGKTCVTVYLKKYEWWSGAKPDDAYSNANWGTPSPLYVRLPCGMLDQQMNVFWNGEVNHCCLDANGELKIGDFREQSLMEIWHGETAKRLRSLVRDGSYAKTTPCDGCMRSPAKRFFSWNDFSLAPLTRFIRRVPPVFTKSRHV